MVDTAKIEKEFSTAMEHLQKYREMAESYDEETKALMLKKIVAQEEKLVRVKEKALSGEVPPPYSR